MNYVIYCALKRTRPPSCTRREWLRTGREASGNLALNGKWAVSRQPSKARLPTIREAVMEDTVGLVVEIAGAMHSHTMISIARKGCICVRQARCHDAVQTVKHKKSKTATSVDTHSRGSTMHWRGMPKKDGPCLQVSHTVGYDRTQNTDLTSKTRNSRARNDRDEHPSRSTKLTPYRCNIQDAQPRKATVDGMQTRRGRRH